MKRSHNFRDLTGQRFNRLVVLSLVSTMPTRWLCQCDCGKTTTVERTHLTSGVMKSCGCYRNENTGNRFRKHGLFYRPGYQCWLDMIKRCENEKDPSYVNYGARGIYVCEEWHSFPQFISDMGEPAHGLEIDRIDNNDGYRHGNCRWATHKENCRNKRNSILLEYGGETRTISGWAEILHMDKGTLNSRIRSRWSVWRAFTAPLRSRRQKFQETQYDIKRC